MITESQHLTTMRTRVWQRLRDLDLSRQQVSTESGLNETFLRNIGIPSTRDDDPDFAERPGKSWTSPSVSNLAAVARRLGCSVGWLIGETDNDTARALPFRPRANSADPPGVPLACRLIDAALDELATIDRATIRALREAALGDAGALERLSRLEAEALDIRQQLRSHAGGTPAAVA